MNSPQDDPYPDLIFSDDPVEDKKLRDIYVAMMTPLHQILTINEHINLYLGNKEAAGSLWNPDSHQEEEIEGGRQRLKSLNIKAIVCCRDMKPVFPNDFKYLVIPMDFDEPIEVDISEKLKKAYDFILENSKEGSVLVHCRNGCTRSASVVTYFVMKYLGVDYEKAEGMVRAKRKCIDVEVFKSRLVDLWKKESE